VLLLLLIAQRRLLSGHLQLLQLGGPFLHRHSSSSSSSSSSKPRGQPAGPPKINLSSSSSSSSRGVTPLQVVQQPRQYPGPLLLHSRQEQGLRRCRLPLGLPLPFAALLLLQQLQAAQRLLPLPQVALLLLVPVQLAVLLPVPQQQQARAQQQPLQQQQQTLLVSR
jgi:hypothetical protein